MKIYKESNQEVINSIEQGDLVDFGQYGKLYVCNPNHSIDYFWVTDDEEDRFNVNASGWSIPKYLAEKIIEKGDSADEDL